MEENKKQGGQLSADEISLFFMQLQLMLKAGILLVDAIALLGQDSSSQREKRLLSHIHNVLEGGMPLYKALEAAACFPEHALRMVQVGEETGRLEQVLAALSQYYGQEHELRQSLRQAVAYPAWLAIIIGAVTFVLVTQVLPIFQQVLGQLGSSITPWAASLMNLGIFSKRGAIILAIVLLALALYLFISTRSPQGQQKLRRLLDTILFRGALGLSVARENFASALALSLASGLSLAQGLEKAQLLLAKDKLADKIAQCGQLLEQGLTFAKAAEDAGVFGGLETGLLAAGFKAGAGDTVMLELANRYHNQTEGILSSMMARLEPILVILLVLVVGMLLLSVMLPLLAMMNAIGG
ncbi:MAG: type II secretion system F family protein [Clostridiales bacterium]|nr:type II secretion system F family protein [Clostridiales bacterium]